MRCWVIQRVHLVRGISGGTDKIALKQMGVKILESGCLLNVIFGPYRRISILTDPCNAAAHLSKFCYRNVERVRKSTRLISFHHRSHTFANVSARYAPTSATQKTVRQVPCGVLLLEGVSARRLEAAQGPVQDQP